MASTITLTGSINWSKPFLRFLPLNIGAGNEPAISIANLVKQTILGPPFCWRWNRGTHGPFNTIVGIQDYARTISDFGFLEKASVTNSGTTYEIPNIRSVLGAAATQSRPDYIAAMLDDNAGVITFRFMNVPDKIYAVNLLYQKKSALLSAVGDTWSPIPDELSFVYNQGFLAFSALYADDPRGGIELQRFLASLIGVSEGLDETQKNFFIESWILSTGQAQAYQQKTQLGLLSRGSLK